MFGNCGAVTSWGYDGCRGIPVPRPFCIAGEEDADGILGMGTTDGRTPDFGPGRVGGCWSTGKKLHSFFRRMQFMHRPLGSAGWRMHLIFRRRQWPGRSCQRARRGQEEFLTPADRKDTYHRLQRCGGSPACSVASRWREQGGLGLVRSPPVLSR